MSGSAAALPRNGVYLRSYLSALAGPLNREDVTDIYVNRPGEVWLETVGGKLEREEIPALDEVSLGRLSRQLAALTHQGISREHPLLSARLPDGSRIQVVAPPATRAGLVLAIRKHVSPQLSLSDYMHSGGFERTETAPLRLRERGQGVTEPVAKSHVAEALQAAVRQRKNILVSGGTSTGKTTFLNALLAEVPIEERLILIEDTPELSVQHPNHVGLVAVRGELGQARVTADDLVAASLRMRPDRIILGELRGVEALAFLRAVNSGHPGSMTTIHADSPEGAVDQLALLVLQAGTKLSRADVQQYVSQTLDVFVQLSRRGGKRVIERVAFKAD